MLPCQMWLQAGRDLETVVTLSILTNMEIPFPIPELYKHNIELAVVRAEIKTGPPPLPPAESK